MRQKLHKIWHDQQGFSMILGLGALLALAVEMFLQPIRTPGRVAAITGAPTLALIPVIETRAEERSGGWRGFMSRIFRNPFRRKQGEPA